MAGDVLAVCLNNDQRPSTKTKPTKRHTIQDIWLRPDRRCYSPHLHNPSNHERGDSDKITQYPMLRGRSDVSPMFRNFLVTWHGEMPQKPRHLQASYTVVHVENTPCCFCLHGVISKHTKPIGSNHIRALLTPLLPPLVNIIQYHPSHLSHIIFHTSTNMRSFGIFALISAAALGTSSGETCATMIFFEVLYPGMIFDAAA